jgi:hypothetical protein
MGSPLHRADSGKPIHIIAKSFPVVFARNRLWFLAAMGLLLLSIAEIGMPLWICLNCSRILIPVIDTIAASLCPLSDDWLSAISYLQQEPMEIDKPHYFVLCHWNWFFCYLKDKVPSNFQQNTQRPNTALISIDWYYFWPTLVYARQSL